MLCPPRTAFPPTVEAWASRKIHNSSIRAPCEPGKILEHLWSGHCPDLIRPLEFGEPKQSPDRFIVETVHQREQPIQQFRALLFFGES